MIPVSEQVAELFILALPVASVAWTVTHDWRGYLIAGFSLVWVANFYMSIFGHVRLGVKRERIELEVTEREAKDNAA